MGRFDCTLNANVVCVEIKKMAEYREKYMFFVYIYFIIYNQGTNTGL